MEWKRFFSRLEFNAPVVLTFTTISFLVLLLGTITGGKSTQLFFSVYRSSFLSPLFYFRLVGHIFGHADFPHFFNNFLYILLLGPMLEEKYGSRNLVVMIFITALVTGIINVLFFKTGLLGASGIVFMMILLSSITDFSKGKIPVTLILVMIFYLGQEAINGLFVKDNISHLTHIFGGICGGSFGYYLNRR